MMHPTSRTPESGKIEQAHVERSFWPVSWGRCGWCNQRPPRHCEYINVLPGPNEFGDFLTIHQEQMVMQPLDGATTYVVLE
jgi:hypothetical protein